MNKQTCCELCHYEFRNKCNNPNCPCHTPAVNKFNWKFVCLWTDNEPEIQRRLFLPEQSSEVHIDDYAVFDKDPFVSRNQELIKRMEQLHSKHQNCGCCSESLWNDVLALLRKE